MPQVPDPIRWTGTRYRDPETGRFISRTRVRRELERSLGNLTRLTDMLVDDLRAGRISLVEWREEMRTIIKQVQMASAELAAGGRAQMTQADYGRVGQRVRVQYEYLERWVQEIALGSPLDGRMEPRARQYLRAGRTAFLETEAEQQAQRGMWARNVLRPAEHCADCIAETRKGLVPVSFLVPIGQRRCLGNCKCYFIYEKAA